MRLKLKARTPVDWAERYRPRTWAEVIGQEGVVKSVAQAIERRTLPRGFLLSGPSGVGKTSIARLIAKHLGVVHTGLVRPPAGTYSGQREMRELAKLAWISCLGTPARLVLLDECQGVTRSAWDSLLEPLESGGRETFFALCTTEPEKLPSTILTRVLHYKLVDIPSDRIAQHLGSIAAAERLKVSERTIGMAARRAAGSMRGAINYLAMSVGLADEDPGAWPF